jgi:hypothetical protein
MNLKDKNLLMGMITIGCFLCLLGFSFVAACAASEPLKQNKASIEDKLKKFLSYYYNDLDSPTSESKTKKFLLSLDHESRVQIARKLIENADGRIVYFGADILIEEEHMDEAIPALANLITSGRDETDLKGRFAYDWAHSSDEFLALKISTKILRYFISNWINYTDAERTRAYRLLSAWLQLDSKSTFSADVAERALQKLESELPSSKKDK